MNMNSEFEKVYEDKLCKLHVSPNNEPYIKIYKISSNENWEIKKKFVMLNFLVVISMHVIIELIIYNLTVMMNGLICFMII